MDFVTFVVLELVVGIPCILYYYKWGVNEPKKGKDREDDRKILHNIELSYIFTSVVTVYIIGLLLYFLYTNMVSQYTKLFMRTAGIMLLVAIVFEIANYFAFEKYEKRRRLEKL